MRSFGARLKLAGRIAWQILSGRQLFKGADVNRLTADWNPWGGTADDDVRGSLMKLRKRARELRINNGYARQYLNLLAVNVIGPHGVRLQAQVRNNNGKLAKDFNTKIEAAWDEWSLAPTVAGKQSRVRFEHMILKGIATDGEALVRKWRGFEGNRFGFALEAIDPDQLDETFNRMARGSQNEIRMGVEVDSVGRPVAYHIWDRPLSGMGLLPQRQRLRIPAADIIHLYDPDRVNQTRGITWFNPVMLPLKMLEGYIEAELVAARMGASKMGFFQTRANSDQTTVLPTGDPNNPGGAISMEANPGTFEFLPQGYELAEFDPNHPSGAFPEFVRAALRCVATGFSCSYNALANDLEGVNYSSMRSGLLIEREVWRALQQWIIGAFYREVYPEWMNMSLLTGALSLDSRDARKFLAAKWIARGWDWVDPLKDSQAGVLGIQTGLDSRTQLLGERGLDLEEILEDLQREAELAADYGIDISGPPAGAASMSAGADNTNADETKPGKGKSNGKSIDIETLDRDQLIALLRDGGRPRFTNGTTH